MTVVGVSGDSQVSVRERTSSEWSEMNSCKTAGLCKESVTDEIERMLRHENERELDE